MGKMFSNGSHQDLIANTTLQEADRLWFEDRIPGVPSTHIAIFGI